MARTHTILLIIYFLFSFSTSYSQNYSFRHFTVEDGLPSSEVYHVYQDSKGYIWFATDNGVSRYDGYSFKNFSMEDGLPDVTVFEIYEDYKNRVWFIPHSAKLSYFYNDSIVKYKYNKRLRKYMGSRINPLKLSFTVDSNNTVYYSDKDNGAFSVDSSGNVEKYPENHFIIKNNRVLKSFLFPDYYNSTGSSYTIHIVKNSLSYNFDSLKNLYFHIHYFAIHKNNNVYIAALNKLLSIKQFTSIEEKQMPSDIIWMNSDQNDNLWLGTRNGALCLKQGNIHSSPVYHILKNHEISSVLCDNEGGYWFSTLYNGVYYAPNLKVNAVSIGGKLIKETANYITGDSSTIWIALQHKLIELNHSKRYAREIFNYPKHSIYRIKYDYIKKRLIIAIAHKTLEYYRLKNNNRLNHRYGSGIPVLNNTTVRNLYIDSTGNFWVTHSTGFFLYNEYTNTCKNLIPDISFKAFDFNEKENVFLLCSTSGLWHYSLENEQLNYLGDKHQLFKRHFTCIIKNKYHHNFWLGTKANGIIVYNDSLVCNITTKNGLSSNFITSLFFKDNTLWAATNKGLNKIDLTHTSVNKFNIEVLDINNGMVSNEVNDVFVLDSTAYIATKEGLSMVNYKDIKLNRTPPPVYIKQVIINDKDTTVKPHYLLTHKQNTLNIEYVGLMYKNIGKKKYKYQFGKKRENPGWAETNERYLHLSSLSPGEYIFKVKAINENNIESIEPAVLSFIITPPYWETWWFILSVVVIVLTILYILYRLRIHEIEKRNRREKDLMQEINKYRQQALSQQMNPHFIFNTLNSIQYYIYNNDHISSSKYLAKFSSLMRLILENSQHDIIPLQKELEAMQLYLELESIRFEKSIQYKIEVKNNLDTSLYNTFPLLLQPYIENAIWHGLAHKKGQKKLKIVLTEKNDYIECIIKDNGIGREKAMEIKNKKKQKYNSLGTNITSKRVDMVNKIFNCKFDSKIIDLKNNEGIGIGTRVIINIPKNIE